MRPFTYERATEPAEAIAAVSKSPDAAFIAGGTELVNWLKEGIAEPGLLVDINALPLDAIEIVQGCVRIGALARMSDVAAHQEVRARLPAVCEALDLSASAQLRNMASIGGNLLQRTRCPYFRAETALPCNKRAPGTGCSALTGSTRAAAIFGTSEHCVATHPSDLAVALAALDAYARVRGPAGDRMIPVTQFYRLPGHDPSRDTVLGHGELIVQIDVPVSPLAATSRYLKLRERSSYEFALVSVAAAVELEGNHISDVRLALGGVASQPWRMVSAERELIGATLEPAKLRAAIEATFIHAKPLPENGFKLELAKRAALRALLMAAGKV